MSNSGNFNTIAGTNQISKALADENISDKKILLGDFT